MSEYKFINQCQNCGVNFPTNRLKTKTCSVTCKMVLRTAHNAFSDICENCGKLFVKTAKNGDKFCCILCRTVARSHIKFVGAEGIDYITCPLCNLRTRQFNPAHAHMHGFQSIKDMQQALGLSQMMCETKKMKGEKNPGYQHGGKLSPWSKNFKNGYDAEKHKALIADHIIRNKTEPHRFKTNIAYWLAKTNGDEDLARELYRKFQTRDLAWFVEKYGEQEGAERHAAKTSRWISTLTSKSADEKLEINRKRNTIGNTSKGEIELRCKLQETYPDIVRQFIIPRKLDVGTSMNDMFNSFYSYDMCLGNKIIEYNGDYWHANPKKYDETFVSRHDKRTYAEIHARDADKIRVANENGYQVLTVWESDYKYNKPAVIKECTQFLKQ